MKYALRKLIAFVFLMGILWLIYRDMDEVWDPAFRASIAGLLVTFAALWLLIPVIVVWLRIWKRTRKNIVEYTKWRDATGVEGLRPCAGGLKFKAEPGETAWFHEKGTFYVDGNPAFDAATVSSRIGDVAFPREQRVWRKAQRVHCYFTDRRVLFLGKEIDCDVPLAELSGFKSTVGGLVFDIRKEGIAFRVAFTFGNPLIAATILNLQIKNKAS